MPKFKEIIKSKKKSKKIIGFFLVLILLASSWSLFSPKFFRVHDHTQAGRIAEMTTALKDGHFPVRWVSNFGYGYGMPLFEFYGPLPFYAGSLFYGLGISAVGTIKILYLIANAGTILGAYLLGKKLFGRAGGVLTATAMTMAPYRAVNLFVRGALNETWAIMFLPWILLGIIKIFHQDKFSGGGKRAWLWFVLPLTGLFLTHNITTMLFLPVVIIFSLGYALWMILQKSKEVYRNNRFRWLNFFRIIKTLFLSGLLAIGMASFYLIPAFFEKDLTQFRQFILMDYFDYNLHFVFIRQFFDSAWGYGGSAFGPNDGFSFFFGWGQWLGLIVLGALSIWEILRWLFSPRSLGKKTKKWRLSVRQIVIGSTVGLLLIGSLFMTIGRSKPVWDLIELLKFSQFPWRWLGISLVLLAIFIGAITWLIVKKSNRSYLALSLSVIIMLSTVAYFRPEFYLDNNEKYYSTDESNIRNFLSTVLPDYISIEMKTPPTQVVDQLILNQDSLPKSDAESVEILVDRVHEKLINTNFSTETRLSLAVASYPGWRAEIDKQWWSQEKGDEGNIELLVPAGSHLVSLRFEGTIIRNYADWASAFSWLLFIYLLLPKDLNADEKKKGRTKK